MAIRFRIPDLIKSGVVCLDCLACRVPAKSPSDSDCEKALLNPVWAAPGKRTVFDTINPDESVCFVVSDHTRKTAADRILPLLVDGLTRKGCSLDHMFILFASGVHRHPTDSEVEKIIGKGMVTKFGGRIFFHNPDEAANLLAVGTTRRGHTVRLNYRAVRAKRLVLVGSVVYHYHAGFGGGRKSLVPGLASRETIAYNHSLTLDPHEDRIMPSVVPGGLDGNPVAEEMMEAALMRKPDFIVNTVLTPDDRLAGVFAGDIDAAHRAACKCAEQIYRCDIKEQADLVLASAGAALNWVQSHKALYNADRAAKPAGRIVLAAACPEGLGDERFRHWITRQSTSEIFAGLRTNPEILGQTALSTKQRGARTILVTEMKPEDAEDLGIRTAPDLKAAARIAVEELRAAGIEKPTYYVMPEALYTVPFPPEPAG